jgi:hypothetical protein
MHNEHFYARKLHLSPKVICADPTLSKLIESKTHSIIIIVDVMVKNKVIAKDGAEVLVLSGLEMQNQQPR